MIGKKINQLATELSPLATDLTIIGDPTTGVSKKITLEQISSLFGGSVSFYTNLASFPAVGNIDIIYCAKDTNKLYLWSGSAYIEVFPSQALLDTYQLRSEKGNANGYASLDSLGKVPISQLPSSLMEYKGTWNAATNTPTLANGTGDTGDVYICNVAGTVNFGAGPLTFAVGDYVIYSGTIWQRSSGAVGTVTSVAVSRSGDALAITGSPITTSGTINLGFAGNSTQYINGAGNLVTFPGVINEAQNLITEVYNKTGATLTKGTVVYINGGQGNLPSITKALATGDSTSAQTYGIVRNDITNNNNGYVVVAGRISDLDTQAYTEGTQLYLSPTTAGTFTSTKPYAPNHLVYVGIVVRAHPTQGVVEVKIQNGYEMDELHNVAAQNPDNNDILQYKTTTSLWTKVAGTTSNITEGSNLYYTDARSRAALSFTAGSGAYNSTTGVITIPTNTNQLTNGAAFITLASLSAGAGISYNNTTGVIASTITQYTDAMARASISETVTGLDYNNTTGVLSLTSGYVIPTTTNETNWNAAYNDKINSAAVTGTTTKTLTLTQQDGGTITASWTDDNTDAVTSVFGRTGAVVAVSGDYNTSQVTENTNLYFTNARAIASTLTGYTSGAGTISATDTILSAIQKLNGNIGALTTGVSSVNGLTGAVTLTTSNIAEGTNLYYTEARVNANTNVAANTAARHNAVTLGTANGLSLSTQVLSLALASGSTTGALSSTDWTTFNNKQSALTNPVTGTGTTNYLPKFTGTSTIGNSSVQDNGTLVTITSNTAGNSTLNLISSNSVNSGKIQFGGATFGATIEKNSLGADSGLIFNSYHGGAEGYTFQSNGTNVMKLSASGNLGLGVTPSAWASSYAVMQYKGGFVGTSASSFMYYGQNAYSDGSFKYVANGQAGIYAQDAGQHIWYNAPSGTAGNAISFTQAMTLDASGRLGIGTTSLNNLITFTQTIGGSPANLSELEPYATVKVKGRPDRNNIVYIGAIDALTGMLIQSGTTTTAANLALNPFGGNVGIGTTSPSHLLQVISSSNFGAALKVSDVSTQSTGAIALGDGSTSTLGIGMWRAAENSYATQGNWLNIQGISGIAFMSGTGAFGSNTERMTLTSSGNFGIGTTSPTRLFDVSATNPQMTLKSTTTTGFSEYYFSDSAGDSGYLSYAHNGDYLVFGVNSAERMRITSGGNVGIGTTSPNNLLQVGGSVNGIIRIDGAGDGVDFGIKWAASNASIYSNTGSAHLALSTNGSERMRITSGGQLIIKGFSTNSLASAFIENSNSSFAIYSTEGGGTTKDLILQAGGSASAGNMVLKANGNVEINVGSIKTGEPDTGWGRAAIKIGASVSGAAFNVTRYLPVSVDGTVYYINLNSSTP